MKWLVTTVILAIVVVWLSRKLKQEENDTGIKIDEMQEEIDDEFMNGFKD